ncbi:MAG TPA: hypothetical protein VEA40_11085 [Ramlibacter sp.]|nr:hypothetical protein [Ramlibacter sp.]
MHADQCAAGEQEREQVAEATRKTDYTSVKEDAEQENEAAGKRDTIRPDMHAEM